MLLMVNGRRQIGKYFMNVFHNPIIIFTVVKDLSETLLRRGKYGVLLFF